MSLAYTQKSFALLLTVLLNSYNYKKQTAQTSTGGEQHT